MSHAAVKSFYRRSVSCKNARTVQFSGGVEKCPVTQKLRASIVNCLLRATGCELCRDCVQCTVANATIERREMLSLNTASDDRYSNICSF